MRRADSVPARSAAATGQDRPAAEAQGLLLDSGCVLVLPDPRMVWTDVRAGEDWDVVPYLFRVRGRSSALLTSVSDMARRVNTSKPRVRTYCSLLQTAYTDPSVWSRAVPGATELVSTAHEAGHRIAVVSNSTRPMVRALLEAVGRLDASFARALGQVDAIIDSAEVGLVKPDPRVFEHALREIGCSAGASVMIGDSVVEDVDGARGAGVLGYHYDPVGWCDDPSHDHLRSLAGVPMTRLGAGHPDRRS